MKFCTVVAVLIVSVFATSMALPARSAYYQQPSFYYPTLSSPQMMMFRYVQQPSHSAKSYSRLTNDVSEEQQYTEETASSVDYEEPQNDASQDVELVDTTEIEAPVVNELPEVEQAQDDGQVYEDEIAPAVDEIPVAEELPVAETPVEVVAPEVTEDAVNDDDVEADEIAVVAVEAPTVAPKVARKGVPKTARRVVSKAAAPTSLPTGTFFPINFNGASGSSISVANSFSTGDDGSATSHAIAYGQPETSNSKSRPVRRH